MDRINEGISANFRKHLVDLTLKKNASWISEIIMKLDKEVRSQVFTWYLATLYQINGYLVKVRSVKNGEIIEKLEEGKMDILIHNPKRPDSVILVVRGFFTDGPLNFEQVHYQLLNHEKHLASVYHCDHFQLVSFHGYTGGLEELKKFNMLLYTWNDIKEMITADVQVILYAHQLRAYENVWQLWNEGIQRVSVIHATGTGKSYIIGKVVKVVREASERVLVMAPTQYILNYQLPKVIPWVTQDAGTFRMTYAKGAFLKEEEIHEIQPKLIVLDEFHRCGAEQWGEGVQRILNAYPQAKVLGTTAISIRYLENGRDMAQELFHGNVASEITLLDAIKEKILPQPKFITALYTLDEDIKGLKEKLAKSELNTEEKNKLAKKIKIAKMNWQRAKGVKQILKKHLTADYQKILVFCKDVEQLNDIMPKLTRWIREIRLFQKVKAFKVHYQEQDKDENFRLFNEIPPIETVYVLFSIEMLNEGVHVEGANAVIQFRSTVSPRITLQQWGRCIDAGSKLTPLIFDLVNNASNIHLGDIKIAKIKNGSARAKLGLEEREILIVDETFDILQLLDDIKDRLTPWQAWFEKMKTFVANKKNAQPSTKSIDLEEQRLGNWASDQRTHFHKNKLSNKKIKALEGLPCWSWDIADDLWQENFSKLQKFYEQNNSLPKQWSGNQEQESLCKWVHKQRKYFREGKLSDERVNALMSMPGWSWNQSEDMWQKRFRKLQAFIKKNASFPTRTSDNSEERSLCMWAHKQRENYRDRKLSKERIKALRSLDGWNWRMIEDEWKKNYNKLQKFIRKNNQLPDEKLDSSLHAWVIRQRYNYGKNNLSKKRKAALEKLPGWKWKVRKSPRHINKS